jgi:hypothetical protein
VSCGCKDCGYKKLPNFFTSFLYFSSSKLIVSNVTEIFLDGKLDLDNYPDVLSTQKFDALNVRNISVFWQELILEEIFNGCLTAGNYFPGFVAMATNTASDVSYRSIVQRFKKGKLT